MTWLGYRDEDSTIEVYFSTSDGSGGAVAPSSAFEAADVKIYKNGSATQKTATDGLTMTSPFDSITGLHLLQIDTSDDTNDAGFWVAGGRYTVILDPSDETVDSQTVVAPIATFVLGPANVNATQISGDATAADNLEAVYDGANIDGKTVLQALRHLLANAAGDLSGAGSGTEVLKGPDGTTRITATIDGNGNRTNVLSD